MLYIRNIVVFISFMLLISVIACGGDDDSSMNQNSETPSDNSNQPPVGNVLEIPTEGYESATSYTGMTQIWADEFDGTTINDDNWNFQFGNTGWGNNELQNYTDSNTSIEDGHLVIKASVSNGAYYSSRINSSGNFVFKYGRVDVRAALPEGQGIWPAIWMLGENYSTIGWPQCGEIDIMEMIGGQGRESTVHGTIHWDNFGSYANYGGGNTLNSGTFSDKFHVFSITWDEEFIRWFVDDVEYHIVDITPIGLTEFHEKFHFLINLAVGGNWPGNPDSTTDFSQFFIVDYIRVFQKE